MKIGIISLLPGNPWAGSEELWAQMADGAQQAGHQVVISVPRHRVLAILPYRPPAKIAALAKKGVQIQTRTPYFLPGAREVSSSLLRREISWLKPRGTYRFGALFGAKPDVICISQGASYDFVGEVDLQKRLLASKIPYVVVCQANDEGPIENRIRAEAIAFFRNAHRVAFVSQGNLNTARRQLAAPIENGVVVQNPVNMTDLSAVPWPENETAQWACVGRLLNDNKGQDILFEALSDPRWRDRAWQLRLFGSGEDESHLHDLSAYYGFADRIEFGGHVADVRAIWAKHQMLLLTSRKEGTPLALVEALLCGRPVLTTDVAGNAEWVEDEINGFVAAAPTAPLIAETLERAWQRRDEWQAMGETAHQMTAARFNPHAGQALFELLDAARNA